ncbi:ATP-binding protein [Nocardia camponoti]|uniref:Histidine kinase/HSP90-like ATPase domain-containing protein n=1 Tax=Nocardia camponoti TaxID=1616106 RepID=A0A917QB73_9NOCA|nr:ATP-binding protein [Nocardia camponoti]GGK41888.1 hypothetical protein GCM10011591_11710 [Nocardia camponoti]
MIQHELARAATDQIVRRLGVAIGVGALIVMVLELPAVLTQHTVDGHWPEIQLAAAYVMFAPLVAVSARGPAAAIGPFAGAAALCYLAATVATPAIYAAVHAGSIASWPYRGLVLGTMAAGLAWSVRFAAGYAAILAVATSASNCFVIPESSLFGDITRALGVAALFLWCVVYARAAADRVDREGVRQRGRAATVAAAAATERESARFAALIHDAVLSTLLAAARATESTAALRGQAARTLEQLEQSRAAPAVLAIDAPSIVTLLRDATADVAPDLVVGTTLADTTLRVPIDVAQRLAAALTEALRNSLRHAGQRARRAVAVELTATSVQVTVSDDGAGFAPETVPADRLGIAGSIIGRMAAVAGGAAIVESTPGLGTTVTLRWEPDHG